MALPKKKKFIQEVVEEAPVVESTPEFLQELVEPENIIPSDEEISKEDYANQFKIVIQPGRTAE